MAEPRYPKIITRPAKPPEGYAYTDVSLALKITHTHTHLFYLMRINCLNSAILRFAVVESIRQVGEDA